LEKLTQSRLFAPILRALAGLYGLIQGLRVWLYQQGIFKSHKLPLKVICVGNLTVGGTGKTPVVIQLAQLLQRAGRKVVILSRGYKRSSSEETLVVSQGQGALVSWQQAGDEPYLLAQELAVPIIVGKKRYLSGQCALADFSPDILLLDDGYQHLNLQRDINLLVINAANPFGNGCLLPVGILREPLATMWRADVILLSKSDQAQDLNRLIQTIKEHNPQAPIFKAVHQPSALVELGTGKDWGLDWLQGKQIVALCGIGDPASFRHLLEGLGAGVVKEGCYPDHYAYQPQDLQQLAAEALKNSAQAIVTTAKDALRLPEGQKSADGLPVLVLKIELKIADKLKDWEGFWQDV